MIYKFRSAFTKAGVSTAPSSAPVCTVVDSDDNILASAQASTLLVNLPGVYLYSYTGAASLDLIALFHTTDATMDQQDLYSYTPNLTATNLGTGLISWTYNLKDNLGANIADATIWVTSDLAGTVVLASGITDTNGNIIFYLDAGTVYVWGQKSGYNFTNPDTEVVS